MSEIRAAAPVCRQMSETVNLATHPHGIAGPHLGNHVAWAIIDLLIPRAAHRPACAPPQGVVEVCCRAAAIHLSDAALRVIGVGMNSIIDDVAGSVISYSVAAG